MPTVTVTVHPQGLHPMMAAKAHHKHTEELMSVDDIIQEGEVHNLAGDVAGRKAVYAAIRRVGLMQPSDLVPKTGCCSNRGWRASISMAYALGCNV